jgi:hypothetical protein
MDSVLIFGDSFQFIVLKVMGEMNWWWDVIVVSDLALSLRFCRGDPSTRVRTLAASFDLVVDVQLAFVMVLGRVMDLFCEALQRIVAERLWVTFLATFCDRLLARELRLDLLDVFLSLGVISCSLNF